jgi:hypothetical protein
LPRPPGGASERHRAWSSPSAIACGPPNRRPAQSRIHAYIHRSAGCEIGPLMTGACEGDTSGAGTRLSKVGICGAGFPRRIVGSCTKPPRPDPWAKPTPCAKPPRAKLGVHPTTQATANAAAKRRFIIAFLLLFSSPTWLGSNHPTGNDLIAVASTAPFLRSSGKVVPGEALLRRPWNDRWVRQARPPDRSGVALEGHRFVVATKPALRKWCLYRATAACSFASAKPSTSWASLRTCRPQGRQHEQPWVRRRSYWRAPPHEQKALTATQCNGAVTDFAPRSLSRCPCTDGSR